MKQLILLLAFLSFQYYHANAQDAPIRPGELLVQIRADVKAADMVATLNANHTPGGPFTLLQSPAPGWHIYLLGFSADYTANDQLLYAVRRVSGIESAQYNRMVEYRDLEPNDQYWPNQIDMNLVGMSKAWSSSTGGITPNGDTIVVAILEKGAYLEHPDLVANRWYNRAETPDDGLDNDGNGYIDDYKGWNPRLQDDSPGDINNHGTAVNGIIGASGNNIIGVSGVNWNVKLMNMADIAVESEIIEAYYYITNMRRLYNNSNGQKGAFVVATNASFGLNKQFAEDYPLWCAAYDSLGSVGVLTAAATANSHFDVDVVGDMPTSCPSQYMITTTNVDITDNWVSTSGYGVKLIDIGAIGQGTYNVSYDGTDPGYGVFGGTSAAAPHITGAIALMYSMGCNTLTDDALTAPATCAERIRDLILTTVAPNTTLEGITVTGGRLDIGAAADSVRALCMGSIGPLSIKGAVPNPTHGTIRFYYETPTFTPYSFRVFNILGQLMFEESVTPPQFGQKVYKYEAADLPAGVYIFTISKGEIAKSIKFIKN